MIELPDTDAVIFAFRRNVVVAASAGTGKTHRLTALYLLLTLGLTSMGQADDRTPAPAVGPERIVATTFSRAAALEIATRVERALREIVGWDGVARLMFGDAIRAREQALGSSITAGDLKRRAADALARWPSARIDTLHGVARRVVQRHALAVGLAPGTRVLDEEEAQALGDLAVDEALGAALTDGGERADAARGLVVSAGGVWGARRLILRLLDRLDEEGLDPEDLVLADHLAEGRAAAEGLARIARRLTALGSPVFREPAAALTAALAASPPGELLSAAAAESLHELFVRRMPARGKRLPPDDELFDLVDALPGKTKSERALGLAALLRSAPALRAREALIQALIADARARFAAHKRKAGALGFGDLLRVARDTLRDRPEIARAVREDASVLLVDEFQDTSRVQRDLVYLLREREDAAAARPRGASPRAEGLAGHGLFLVGDRKQSIYGFRGADVAVFSRIAAELAGRAAGEALSLPEPAWAGVDPVADFVALRESRRSGAEILAFVNAFSERDFAEDRPAGAPPRAYEIAYGPAEHLVPVLSADPAPARVVFVADDGVSPEGADPIVRESSGAAREAFVAAAYVAALVGRRGDDGGPVRFQDVAVLARRRSTIPLVELGLSRLEIPYVVAGRALYDAPEVRDIAALLRLLLDPRDRLAMATVLRGPVVALSDAALASLSIPGRGLTVPLHGRWPSHKPAGEGDAAPALDQADPAAVPHAERVRLEAFRARYADVRRAALRLAPGEAIRATMTAFDLDRVLAALPRAEARIGNLDRLVTIARRRGGTLAGFVRWLDRRIRDDADEAEAAVFSPEDDAVRLTTIHASKGLDFPVVVLVDLNAAPRGDHGALGFVSLDEGAPPTLVLRHYAPRGGGRALLPLATSTLRASQADARAREQAERRRLTYVAVTRARRALVLVGSATPPRGGTALRSLANGLEQGDLEGVITAMEPAAAVLAEGRPVLPPDRRRDAIDARPPHRPARSTAREIAVDAAALALFRDCPRRFRLRHLLGVEEPASAVQLDLFAAAAPKDPVIDLPPPVAADDDRGRPPRPPQRAAHRVLARWPLAGWGAPVDPRAVAARLAAEGLPSGDAETERIARAIARFLGGPFARAARGEGVTIVRDEPYVLPIEATGKPPRWVLMRGVIDLKVSYPDGRVDVIEVSLSRAHADASSHDFALRAAALAAREGGGAAVRAGVLPLGGEADPVWLRGRGAGGALSEEEHARFEEELGALGQRMAEARYEDRFEGVAVGVCRKLGCGFVEACHGTAAAEGS